MLDRYLHGSVERISPEAPVPVLSFGREENRLGGAANVALNLKALGATPLLVGLVGDDENGRLFRELLQENDLSDAYIVVDSSRCTTVKTRLVASGQQLLRVDREEKHGVGGAAAGAMVDAIKALVGEKAVHQILFQDYNKGVLTPKIIDAVLTVARHSGIGSVVDPKADNFWAYVGCGLFKPNLREIQRQCDFPVGPTLESLDRAADRIFELLDCEAVMITLSEHGIYVNNRQRSAIHPTHARTVRDVSGAGDTVISVAAVARTREMSLDEIATLANRAGAQVIAKSGVVAVDADALDD